MKKQKLYPITYSFVTDHPEELTKIFLKVRPHKGAFVGVTELEGCFLCDSPGELYSSLEIGEMLTLIPDKDSKISVSPLSAVRNNGTVVGTLPYTASVLPSKLITLGVEVCCYVEAKAFNAGLLSIAVSIYSEKY